MPKPQEVATVSLGGQQYSTWESVRVELDFMDMATRSFQVSITEKTDPETGQRLNSDAVWSAMQIKPGDACTVALAGIPVINGFVEQRQTGYDGNHHGVLVAGRSKTNDYVDGTIDRKSSHFRKKNLEDIAKQILQPFGLQLRIVNPPKNFDKKFEDVSSNPGETAHSFIERLARARGAFVRDDKDGNVVIGTADGQASGVRLVEGENIKTMNCLIRDDNVFSKIAAVGQQRGTDQVWGEPSRKPSAVVSGASSRHRPFDILVEEPGDAEDMKARVEHERNVMLGNIIEATIQVQGWLKNGAELWDVGETIPVYSPMAMLDHDLGVKTVVFSQDESGTFATLTLVRPEALGSIAKPGISSDPNASVLPGGSATPGQAIP